MLDGKETRTGDQIRMEVSRLLHASGAVAANRARIAVPLPERATPGCEVEGCNWHMPALRSNIYRREIEAAVRQVMSRWNLK